MRRQFAEKANSVGPWIERQMDAVASIAMGMQVRLFKDFFFPFDVAKLIDFLCVYFVGWMNVQGSLEDQLVRLKEYEQNVYAYKSHMEELEKLNQGIQESMVFENRYTQYTMETLRVGWEQLLTSINRNINEVENQILTRDSKGIKV